MARVITLKKSGKQVYVVGDVPEKKGDRFQATTVLEAGPPPGCSMGNLAGGGAYFACSRGGGIHAPVKDFVYDPSLHEIDEENALDGG